MILFLRNLIVTPLSFLFLVIWTPLFILLTVIIGILTLMPFFSFCFIQKLLKFWGKFGFYLTLSRIELQNKQNFSVKDPVIIITNHRSLIDVLLGLGFFEKNFLFLSKKENFSIPIIGNSMKRAGFISVDRASPRKAAQSVLQMMEKLKEGENILIYPEGTRNYKTNRILRLKTGFMTIAMKSKATILPIITHDTKDIYSPARKCALFPQKVRVRVLEPILLSNEIHPSNTASGMTQTEQLERIQNLMQETFDDLGSKKE